MTRTRPSGRPGLLTPLAFAVLGLVSAAVPLAGGPSVLPHVHQAVAVGTTVMFAGTVTRARHRDEAYTLLAAMTALIPTLALALTVACAAHGLG